MFYTIYEIKCLLNNKTYIGKHQTNNLDDGYFGSGKLLKRAIQKHGILNFTKEILFVFDNEKEMNEKEKELVKPGPNSYNLCDGGLGGFGYINRKGLNIRFEQPKSQKEKIRQWHKKHPEHLQKIFEKNKKTGQFQRFNALGQKSFLGKHHSKESKRKIGLANSKKIPWNKGIPRTPEEKEKIKQGVLNKMTCS